MHPPHCRDLDTKVAALKLRFAEWKANAAVNAEAKPFGLVSSEEQNLIVVNPTQAIHFSEQEIEDAMTLWKAAQELCSGVSDGVGTANAEAAAATNARTPKVKISVIPDAQHSDLADVPSPYTPHSDLVDVPSPYTPHLLQSDADSHTSAEIISELCFGELDDAAAIDADNRSTADLISERRPGEFDDVATFCTDSNIETAMLLFRQETHYF